MTNLKKVFLRVLKKTGRFLCAHHRRIVSSYLVLSFTFSMTGMPMLLAQASTEDNYHKLALQENYQLGMNPATAGQEQDPFTAAPLTNLVSLPAGSVQFSDTFLNAKFSPDAKTRLATGDFQTLASKYASGWNADSLVQTASLSGMQWTGLSGKAGQGERAAQLELAANPYFSLQTLGDAGAGQSLKTSGNTDLSKLTFEPKTLADQPAVRSGVTASAGGSNWLSQLLASAGARKETSPAPTRLEDQPYLSITDQYFESMDTDSKAVFQQSLADSDQAMQPGFTGDRLQQVDAALQTAKDEAARYAGDTLNYPRAMSVVTVVEARKCQILDQQGKQEEKKALLIQLNKDAAASGNPGCKLLAAKLLLQDGQTQQAASTAEWGRRNTINNQNLFYFWDARVEAEYRLQMVELLSVTGPSGSTGGVYNELAEEKNRVKTYLTEIKPGEATPQDLSMAIRLNGASKKNEIDVQGLSEQLAAKTAQSVQSHGWSQPGQYEDQTLGRITIGQSGECTLDYISDGKQVSLALAPGEGAGAYAASGITVRDPQTQQVEQIYENQDGKLTLTATLTQLSLKTETYGSSPVLAKVNALMFLTEKPMSVTAYQDKIYAVPASGYLHYNLAAVPKTQALSKRTSEAGIYFQDNKVYQSGGGKAKSIDALANEDITVLNLPEALSSQLLGKKAWQTNQGTTFIGTEDDIVMQGNYQVAGTNRLTPASGSGEAKVIGYLATYREGVLARVELSDGKVIDVQDGSLQDFTVTERSADGQRTAISTYAAGELVGTSLELKKFGVTLQYDAQGQLTPESLETLSGGGSGFRFEQAQAGGDFTLIATDGTRETYSSKGFRVQASGFDPNAAYPGQVQTLDVDSKQALTIKIAKYRDSQGQSLTFTDSKRQHVSVQMTGNLQYTRTTSTSSILGDGLAATAEALTLVLDDGYKVNTQPLETWPSTGRLNVPQNQPAESTAIPEFKAAPAISQESLTLDTTGEISTQAESLAELTLPAITAEQVQPVTLEAGDSAEVRTGSRIDPENLLAGLSRADSLREDLGIAETAWQSAGSDPQSASKALSAIGRIRAIANEYKASGVMDSYRKAQGILVLAEIRYAQILKKTDPDNPALSTDENGLWKSISSDATETQNSEMLLLAADALDGLGKTASAGYLATRAFSYRDQVYDPDGQPERNRAEITVAYIEQATQSASYDGDIFSEATSGNASYPTSVRELKAYFQNLRAQDTSMQDLALAVRANEADGEHLINIQGLTSALAGKAQTAAQNHNWAGLAAGTYQDPDVGVFTKTADNKYIMETTANGKKVSLTLSNAEGSILQAVSVMVSDKQTGQVRQVYEKQNGQMTLTATWVRITVDIEKKSTTVYGLATMPTAANTPGLARIKHENKDYSIQVGMVGTSARKRGTVIQDSTPPTGQQTGTAPAEPTALVQVSMTANLGIQENASPLLTLAMPGIETATATELVTQSVPAGTAVDALVDPISETAAVSGLPETSTGSEETVILPGAQAVENPLAQTGDQQAPAAEAVKTENEVGAAELAVASETMQDNQGIAQDPDLPVELGNALATAQDALFDEKNEAKQLSLINEAAASATASVKTLQPGTEAYRKAMAVLTEIEMCQYLVTKDADMAKGILADLTNHANASGDMLMLLAAIKLQAMAGNTEAVMDTAGRIFDKRNSISDPAERAEVTLKIAELYSLAGAKGPIFEAASREVEKYLESLPVADCTLDDMGMAMKVSQITGRQNGKTTAMAAQLADNLQTTIDTRGTNFVGGKWENCERGYYQVSEDVPTQGLPAGTIVKKESGTTLADEGVYTLDTTDNSGHRIIMTMIPPAKYSNDPSKCPPKELVLSKMEVYDLADGQLVQMYEAEGKELKLTAIYMNVDIATADNKTQFVKPMMIQMKRDNEPLMVKHEGKIYAVDIDADSGKGIATPMAEAYQLEALTNVPKATELDFDRATQLTLTQESLAALGLPQDSELAGKVAFKTGDTFFIGTQSGIQSGNYQVAGANHLQSADGQAARDFGYTATYVDGKLQDATLYEKSEIETAAPKQGKYLQFTDGSTKDFTVTEKSEDGQRIAVSTYQDGKLQGTAVTLLKFNVVMEYDAQGDLTKECFSKLKAGGAGYRFEQKQAGGTFSLIASDGVRETFTEKGRRVMNSEGSDDQSQSTQETLEFDIQQELNIDIAQYGNPQGQRVTLQDIQKEQVVVAITKNPDNTVDRTRTSTRSTVLGDFMESTAETWSITGHKVAYKETSRTYARVATIKDASVLHILTGSTYVMQKDQNGGWSTQGGAQFNPGDKDAKGYYELQDGKWRHTSDVKQASKNEQQYQKISMWYSTKAGEWTAVGKVQEKGLGGDGVYGSYAKINGVLKYMGAFKQHKLTSGEISNMQLGTDVKAGDTISLIYSPAQGKEKAKWIYFARPQNVNSGDCPAGSKVSGLYELSGSSLKYSGQDLVWITAGAADVAKLGNKVKAGQEFVAWADKQNPGKLMAQGQKGLFAWDSGQNQWSLEERFEQIPAPADMAQAMGVAAGTEVTLFEQEGQEKASVKMGDGTTAVYDLKDFGQGPQLSFSAYQKEVPVDSEEMAEAAGKPQGETAVMQSTDGENWYVSRPGSVTTTFLVVDDRVREERAAIASGEQPRDASVSPKKAGEQRDKDQVEAEALQRQDQQESGLGAMARSGGKWAYDGAKSMPILGSLITSFEEWQGEDDKAEAEIAEAEAEEAGELEVLADVVIARPALQAPTGDLTFEAASYEGTEADLRAAGIASDIFTKIDANPDKYALETNGEGKVSIAVSEVWNPVDGGGQQLVKYPSVKVKIQRTGDGQSVVGKDGESNWGGWLTDGGLTAISFKDPVTGRERIVAQSDYMGRGDSERLELFAGKEYWGGENTGEITIHNDYARTWDSFNAETGKRTTSWDMQLVNEARQGWGNMVNALNGVEKALGSFWQNLKSLDLGGAWESLPSVISSVANLALAAVEVLVTPVKLAFHAAAAGFMGAPPVFHNLVTSNLEKLMGGSNAVTKTLDNVVLVAGTMGSGLFKAAGDNAFIVAMLVLGPLTGGATWVATFGHVFMLAMFASNINKGLSMAAAGMFFTFVAKPISDVFRGGSKISGAWSLQSGAKTFEESYANSIKASAGFTKLVSGIVMTAFIGGMARGPARAVRSIARTVSMEAQMGALNFVSAFSGARAEGLSLGSALTAGMKGAFTGVGISFKGNAFAQGAAEAVAGSNGLSTRAKFKGIEELAKAGADAKAIRGIMARYGFNNARIESIQSAALRTTRAETAKTSHTVNASKSTKEAVSRFETKVNEKRAALAAAATVSGMMKSAQSLNTATSQMAQALTSINNANLSANAINNLGRTDGSAVMAQMAKMESNIQQAQGQNASPENKTESQTQKVADLVSQMPQGESLVQEAAASIAADVKQGAKTTAKMFSGGAEGFGAKVLDAAMAEPSGKGAKSVMQELASDKAAMKQALKTTAEKSPATFSKMMSSALEIKKDGADSILGGLQSKIKSRAMEQMLNAACEDGAIMDKMVESAMQSKAERANLMDYAGKSEAVSQALCTSLGKAENYTHMQSFVAEAVKAQDYSGLNTLVTGLVGNVNAHANFNTLLNSVMSMPESSQFKSTFVDSLANSFLKSPQDGIKLIDALPQGSRQQILDMFKNPSHQLNMPMRMSGNIGKITSAVQDLAARGGVSKDTLKAFNDMLRRDGDVPAAKAKAAEAGAGGGEAATGGAAAAAGGAGAAAPQIAKAQKPGLQQRAENAAGKIKHAIQGNQDPFQMRTAKAADMVKTAVKNPVHTLEQGIFKATGFSYLGSRLARIGSMVHSRTVPKAKTASDQAQPLGKRVGEALGKVADVVTGEMALEKGVKSLVQRGSRDMNTPEGVANRIAEIDAKIERTDGKLERMTQEGSTLERMYDARTAPKIENAPRLEAATDAAARGLGSRTSMGAAEAAKAMAEGRRDGEPMMQAKAGKAGAGEAGTGEAAAGEAAAAGNAGGGEAGAANNAGGAGNAAAAATQARGRVKTFLKERTDGKIIDTLQSRSRLEAQKAELIEPLLKQAQPMQMEADNILHDRKFDLGAAAGKLGEKMVEQTQEVKSAAQSYEAAKAQAEANPVQVALAAAKLTQSFGKWQSTAFEQGFRADARTAEAVAAQAVKKALTIPKVEAAAGRRGKETAGVRQELEGIGKQAKGVDAKLGEANAKIQELEIEGAPAAELAEMTSQRASLGEQAASLKQTRKGLEAKKNNLETRIEKSGDVKHRLTQQVLTEADLSGKHYDIASKVLEQPGNADLAGQLALRAAPEAKAEILRQAKSQGRLEEVMSSLSPAERSALGKDLSKTAMQEQVTTRLEAGQALKEAAEALRTEPAKAEGALARANAALSKLGEKPITLEGMKSKAKEGEPPLPEEKLREAAAEKLDTLAGTKTSTATDLMALRPKSELTGSKPGEGMLSDPSLRKAAMDSGASTLTEAAKLAEKTIVSSKAMKQVNAFKAFENQQGQGMNFDQAVAKYQETTGKKFSAETLGIKSEQFTSQGLDQVTTQKAWNKQGENLQTRIEVGRINARIEQARSEGNKSEVQYWSEQYKSLSAKLAKSEGSSTANRIDVQKIMDAAKDMPAEQRADMSQMLTKFNELSDQIAAGRDGTKPTARERVLKAMRLPLDLPLNMAAVAKKAMNNPNQAMKGVVQASKDAPGKIKGKVTSLGTPKDSTGLVTEQQKLIESFHEKGYADALLKGVGLESRIPNLHEPAMVQKVSETLAYLTEGIRQGEFQSKPGAEKQAKIVDMMKEKYQAEEGQAMSAEMEGSLRNLLAEVGKSEGSFGTLRLAKMIKNDFGAVAPKRHILAQIMKSELGYKESSDQLKADGPALGKLRAQYQAEIAELLPELNVQSRKVMAELVIRYQMDANYRKFNLEMPQALTFLLRQSELHYINLELHGRNQAVKSLIGEALQLTMGGGKSCSPLCLDIARQLYRAEHPGKPAPAMVYMTMTDALSRQIMEEPTFRDMKEGISVVTKDTAESVIKNGFKEDNIYVVDCETLKHIVLEQRSQGKSDSQISRTLQEKLGTVAWDEIHAAFHVTDTIIGASGIFPYLSKGMQAQVGKLAVEHLAVYADVRQWFRGRVENADGSINRETYMEMFKNSESAPGKEVRNQMTFSEKAMKEIQSATGLNFQKTGDAMMLDKMAKVLSTSCGREWFGGIEADGKIVYGTAEGGVGKPNTIFGDTLQAAFTNCEIFLNAHPEITSAQIRVGDFAGQNPKLIESIGEALVHTTTERVTMMEAMNLLGSQNIVGFSGTLEGMSQSLAGWGKRVIKITAEPVMDIAKIINNELYMSVKAGEDILTMRQDPATGKIKMEISRENINQQDHFVNFVKDLMGSKVDGRTISQQIVTHNDNVALGRTCEKMQAALGRENSELVTISVKAIETHAYLKGKQPEYNQDGTLAEGFAKDMIRDMLQSANPRMVNLIHIDGMAPELWSLAMGEIKGQINAPGGVKRQRIIFAPKIGEGLNTFAAKKGEGTETMGVALHQMDMRPLDVYGQAMTRANVYNTNKVTGERTYNRARGLTGMNLDFNDITNITRGELKQMSSFIAEVKAAMAVKGGKTLEVALTPAKEGFAASGPEGKMFVRFSDLLTGKGEARLVNQETTGQTGVAKQMLNEITAAKPQEAIAAQAGAKAEPGAAESAVGKGGQGGGESVQGTGIAKTILTEVDGQKAKAVMDTKAGVKGEETVAVNVEKGSAEYMPTLAKKVEAGLPEKLMKYQGLTDFMANRSSNPFMARSRMLNSDVFQAGLHKGGKLRMIPYVGGLLNYLDQQQGAIQTSTPKISQVAQYAQSYQSQLWQMQNQELVDNFKSRFGDNWVEAAMTEKFGADYKMYQSLAKTMALPGPAQALAPLAQTWILWRSGSNAMMAVNEKLLDNVALMTQSLAKAKSDSLNFQDTKVTRDQATNLIQAWRQASADLSQRYNLDDARAQAQYSRTAQVREAAAQVLAELPGLNLANFRQTLERNPALTIGLTAAGALALGQIGGLMLAGTAFTLGSGLAMRVIQGQPVGPRAWPAIISEMKNKMNPAQQMAAKKQAAAEAAKKTEAAQAAAGGQGSAEAASLVAAWKAQVKEKPDQAFPALAKLLEEERIGIKFEARQDLQTYSQMHMVAAGLDLLGKAKVDLKKVFQSISLGQGTPGAKALVVPGTAAKLTSNRLVELMISKAAENTVQEHAGLASAMQPLDFVSFFQDSETDMAADTPQAQLRQRAVEFAGQYLLHGEELRAELAALAENSPERRALQTAYDSVKNVFQGAEFGSQDLTEIGQAMNGLQQEVMTAYKQMQTEIRNSLPGIGREQMLASKDQEFIERYGLSLAEFKQTTALPLGLRLLNLAKRTAGMQAQPLNKVLGLGKSLVGFGVTTAILAPVLLTGLSLPVLGLLPVALTTVLAGVGLVCLPLGLLLLLQSDAIAWKTNPSEYVANKLAHARLSPDLKAGLLESARFKQAVAGMQVPGALGMVNEGKRNEAVKAALDYLAKTAESEVLPLSKQMETVQQVAKVLEALQIKLQVKEQEGLLSAQYLGEMNFVLTPLNQNVIGLWNDPKIIRLVDRLQNKGISFGLPAGSQGQNRPERKPSSSDSAA